MPRSRLHPPIRFLLLTMILAVPLTVLGQSTIPRLISHQGLLTDASTGDPVADGGYDITFRLYESAAGGSAIWTETQSLTTSDGIFNAILGSVTPLDPVSFSGERWLSLQIDSDSEMSDRVKLTSVPFAMGLALPFVDTVSSGDPLLHLNNAGTSDGILVTNTGSGTAGAFLQQDPSSTSSGVYGHSEGLGEAVFGQHFGTGPAGKFLITNNSSPAAALHVETTGSGPGAFVKDGRIEVEFNSALGDPHALIRETSAGDYARLSLRNDDNLLFWDIAAGGAANSQLNFFREGVGDIMSLRSSGRVGIGTPAPEERLHINGVVKADSIVYTSPLQGWASVHGSAFMPVEQDGTITYVRGNLFYYNGGTVVAATAPIQLPHNARLETISCRIYDFIPAEDLECKLCRETATGCNPRGSVTSSGSGGLNTYTAPLTSPITVNNQTDSFFIIASTASDTNWASYFDSLMLKGVSIGYTISGAP